MNAQNPSVTCNLKPATCNSLLDEAGRETVRLLESHGVWHRTPNGRGARDSVETALQAGWTGEQCLECVQAWLRYARTRAGRWVQAPGRQAAARLRDLQMPAAEPDESSRYISGEFANYILHEQEARYGYPPCR